MVWYGVRVRPYRMASAGVRGEIDMGVGIANANGAWPAVYCIGIVPAAISPTPLRFRRFFGAAFFWRRAGFLPLASERTDPVLASVGRRGGWGLALLCDWLLTSGAFLERLFGKDGSMYCLAMSWQFDAT